MSAAPAHVQVLVKKISVSIREPDQDPFSQGFSNPAFLFTE
jgi:hypothetical protein